MGQFYQGWHNKQVTAKMGNGQTCHFRSKFEHTWAGYLDFLLHTKAVINWEYESKTFWFHERKSGVRLYKPDFFIETPDGNCWHETKMHLVGRDIAKFHWMSKYHPDEIMVLVMDKRTKRQAPMIEKAKKWVNRVIYAKEILAKVGMVL